MQVGDVLHIRPNFYCEYGMTDEIKVQACRVVYLHPEDRFYVVEFTSALGRTWRESFFPANRRISGIVDQSAPYLDIERRHT